MIKWKKIEAGEYVSDSGRFSISKTWDRIYGNHWELHDKTETVACKGTYCEKTLLDCKLKAEAIADHDKKLADIVAAKVKERETMGYDYLQDSDVTAILEECKRQRILVTKDDLAKMGLST